MAKTITNLETGAGPTRGRYHAALPLASAPNPLSQEGPSRQQQTECELDLHSLNQDPVERRPARLASKAPDQRQRKRQGDERGPHIAVRQPASDQWEQRERKQHKRSVDCDCRTASSNDR